MSKSWSRQAPDRSLLPEGVSIWNPLPSAKRLPKLIERYLFESQLIASVEARLTWQDDISDPLTPVEVEAGYLASLVQVALGHKARPTLDDPKAVVVVPALLLRAYLEMVKKLRSKPPRGLAAAERAMKKNWEDFDVTFFGDGLLARRKAELAKTPHQARTLPRDKRPSEYNCKLEVAKRMADPKTGKLPSGRSPSRVVRSTQLTGRRKKS
jgi:hypothetical protein